jgi:hypothetical protein
MVKVEGGPVTVVFLTLPCMQRMFVDSNSDIESPWFIDERAG